MITFTVHFHFVLAYTLGLCYSAPSNELAVWETVCATRCSNKKLDSKVKGQTTENRMCFINFISTLLKT